MIIGVTGGVGSGKSTILDILKSDFKAHIILADEVARVLMEPRNKAFNLVVEAFGSDILSDDLDNPCIDRIKLSKLVFQNPEKLKLLNSIVHPLVRVEILNMFDSIYSVDKDALIVLESAILIEAGYVDLLDYLWFVYTRKDLRIERLMSSRGYSITRCMDIMDNQLSDDDYRTHADFTIDNSFDFNYTKEQIYNWFKNTLGV